MRVGVTGAGGLLGSTLVPLWRRAGADVTAWSHQQLDVTDAAAAAAAVGAAPVDVIVHCAAWTDVDGAESEPEAAMRVNAHGTGVMAAAAAAAGAAFVHVSTDYVFDGTARAPIPPGAAPRPLGAYGRSKAAAETLVRDSGAAWLIVRTGWLYGPGGRNFIDTMRGFAARSRKVDVVDDQRGAPTSVRLVADVLWRLVDARKTGVWHAAAAGDASWFDVARAIYEDLGADPALVVPCTTSQLNRRAPRPPYAVLDCSATARALGGALPGWREQLGPYARLGVLPATGLDRVPA